MPNEATEITPSPPTCISIKITVCPKYDQYVAVSYTTSPVTHTADVAVNKAFPKEVTSPVCDEIGNINNIVPNKITPTNPNVII